MESLGRTRSWLAGLWTPCVAVIASEEANRLCQAANGLDVVALLRPFGILNQLNGTVGVPVRTVGDAPFRLHSWRLRFYDAKTMFQPAPEAADNHLKAVLSAAAAVACDEDVPQLQTLLAPETATSDATPWYGVYRDEFLRMMTFGDHETMDHPVACVLVLPSTVQGELVKAFEALYTQPGALPPLMQQGVMEQRIPRHYVLLHDARNSPPGTLERAQQLMQQLGATSMGPQCHLLVINSRTPEQPAGMDSRFWGGAMPGAVAGGGAGEPASYPPLPPGVATGAGLNERDVAVLAEFVRGLAVQHIIPNLETRIRALNHQVTSTRKGLRNQLKSLLWRKSSSSSFLPSAATDSPSATAPATPSSATAAGAAGAHPALHGGYAASSVEGEMRALSDLALMLRDADTALGTLRLLASDFKQDKAWKHYAAVQEALGVATILSNGSAADAIANFKEAFYRYQQLCQAGGRHRVEGTRYATRAAMVLAEYLRALGQHGEANWVFMKAHFAEENLRAGLLLEQAAHSLLRLAPVPHVRKFGFHLVLAGLRYNMCDQKGLALRAYKQVLGVYSGKHWALIEEHLHDVLGRQSREAGDWLGAVQHYMAMVLCPANSLYCQRAYLSQFLDVLRTAQVQLGFDPALELPVPVVNLERVGLQYDSQTAYGTPEARQVKGHIWRPLEAAVQPAAEGGPITWLDGGSRASMADQQPQHTCVVGETVGIEVEVSNPLQVELAITHLRLACSFEPAVGSAAQQPSSSSGGGGGGGSAAAAGASVVSVVDRARPAGLQIREESLTLGPGERVVVALRLVPLKAGTLSVDGVQWMLNGVAQGHQRFRIPRPKPLKPGSSKPLLDAERPPPGGIAFTVLPPMPHLEVSLLPLPSTVALGELLCCPLRLRNVGAMTMHNITCAVATPDMLLTAVEVVSAEAGSGAGAAVGMPASPPAASSRSGTATPTPSGSRPGSGAATPVARAATPDGSVDGRADAGNGGSTSACTSPGAAAQQQQQQQQQGAGLPPKVPGRQARGGSIVSGVEVTVSERQGVTVFSLSSNARLGVGQELQLLLWLRPCAPGMLRWSCVWYYEPVVKLDSLKFRTLRTTLSSVCVPSLDCTAAAAGGRSKPGAVLLQLRCTNQQGVESFRLTNLACPGGTWRLGTLQRQQAGSVEQQQQQHEATAGSSQELEMLVGPEAAATLHYHLTPVAGEALPAASLEAPPSSVSGEALREQVERWFFLRSHPCRRLQPVPSTASLQSAAGAKAAAERQQQQQQQSAAGGVEEGELGAELSVPLDLVVRWEVAGAAADAPRRTGFHVLYQQRVAPGPPIHAQLLGPRVVSHDFGAAPICTVPLLLRVRNTLPEPASVCIDAGKQADGRPTPLGAPTWAPVPTPVDGSSTGAVQSSGGWVQPMQAHVWCGRTRITLPTLPCAQTVEVPLQVATAEPGTLNLTDTWLSWSYAGSPPMTGSRPGPACVVQVQQREQQQQHAAAQLGASLL